MQQVTTHEAKTHLSRFLARVLQGEEFVICRGDVPVARLVPVESVRVTGRPKVGTRTSEAVECSEDVFSGLTDEELQDWGL